MNDVAPGSDHRGHGAPWGRGALAALPLPTQATAPRLHSLPASTARGLIWLYQKTLSPALAAAFPTCGCRFHPTCSHYAREALQEHGFLRGAALAAARLVRCGPWHPGGLDPVPPRQCTRVSPPPTCAATFSLSAPRRS